MAATLGFWPTAPSPRCLPRDGLKSEAALDVDQIQPASLDLRLGSKAFRVRASFMPGPANLVADKLERLKLHVVDLSKARCWRPAASISCR